MSTKRIISLFIVAFILAISADIIGNFAYVALTEESSPQVNLITSEQFQALITGDFTESADVRLERIYGALLTQASVCWDCYQFIEQEVGSFYMAYPIVGPTIIHDSHSYTMVLGEVGFVAGHQPSTTRVTPMVVVYIEDESGTVTRLGNENYTYPAGSRLKVSLDAGDYSQKVDEAIHAFKDFLFDGAGTA